jgi:cytochrome c peroxidase
MTGKLLLFCFAAIIILLSFRMKEDPHVVPFLKPDKWPEPVYDFKKSPITQEGFELGRKLFYDPILSRDKTISCASCHLQYTGFTHVDHNVSHGIEGRKGTRNSPVLINLAWQKTFHWDGGVNHIEVQGINPIQHPAEMDNTLDEVIKRLTLSEEYRSLFTRAFGTKEIITPRIMKALSMFTLSLVSSNSKYDQVKRGTQGVEFSDQEKKGYKLFKKYCTACHTEPLLTNTFYASNGLPIDTLYNDLGRFAITRAGKDSLQFKIPTLRNIEVTFPYMHDGRFRKLKEVINYYSEGIDPDNKYLSPQLKGPFHFSEYEKKDLLAFLLTLTDRAFLYEKRFSFPK